MALNILYFAIDCMQGTIFLVYYLLFKFQYLLKIDVSQSFKLLLNSKNNNNTVILNENQYTNIQSAENCEGFSETTRQLSNYINIITSYFEKKVISKRILLFEKEKYQNYSVIDHDIESESIKQILYKETIFNRVNSDSDTHFYSWFAGILDGDGNFDIRKDSNNCFMLKAIVIKLHNRDVRILTRIQNYLHIGRIKTDKKKPYSRYIVSTKKDMEFIITRLNGLIRLKIPGFKKSCAYFNIKFKEPNYKIEAFDSYFAGLIDTDGSIVFNYPGNRIECNLEFQYNEFTQKLNLDDTIPFYKPNKLLRKQKSKQTNKDYYSIGFKYQTVRGMMPLYNFFMKNRLYSDFKFYRVTKIKEFLLIRDYNKEPKGSAEFKIYSDFLLDWIQYRNPLWMKVPFVEKIR
jgi:LAGLIDADG endonuclease